MLANLSHNTRLFACTGALLQQIKRALIVSFSSLLGIPKRLMRLHYVCRELGGLLGLAMKGFYALTDSRFRDADALCYR